MLKRVGTVVAVGAALWAQGVGAQLAQQGGKLVGTDATGSAWQASAVAVSADGNTAIVGGYLDNGVAGAGWVFSRSGGVWTQQGSKLVGGNGSATAAQGWSVAISGDGNTAIIGGPGDNSGTGAAWVFARSGGVWAPQGSKLVGGGATGHANQGSSVALSADGNTAIVGGPGDKSGVGAVWVFTRSGSTWKQQGSKLVATGAVGSAGLGSSVALSGDASTIIAGGPQDNNGSGAVWVFTVTSGKWALQGNKLIGSAPNTMFTITGEASVTASFTQQPTPCYTFATAVSPLKEGEIKVNTPQTCTGGYTPGTQILLNLTPTSGWVFTGWTGTGGSFSTLSSIETKFTITANATVTANVLLSATTCDDLTIAVNPTGAGTAIVNTSVNCTNLTGYYQGSRVLLTAMAATGWIFSGWTGTGGAFSSTSSQATWFTFSDNATVTANFAQPSTNCEPLLVGASPSSAGSVTVNTPQSCSGGYTWGTPISITANPAPGWTFSGWSGSGGAFSNPAGLSASARQGTSVALSSDGNTAIVGGSVNASTGTVWIFNRSSSTWLQQGNPISVSGDASLAHQAWSVALSGDGNTALLAEPGDNNGMGAAWLFTRSGGVWTQQGTRLVGTGAAGEAGQGSAVALSSDGSTAIIGGPNDNGGAGAAWVFASGASPACTFGLSPASQGFAAIGGTGTLAVTVLSGTDCPWVTVSNVPWVAVTQGTTGSGHGQVGYAVSSNAGVARAGTLDVAGQTFTIYQAGTNCSYALDASSASFGASGGQGSFNVSAPADCPWISGTTTPWLHVTAGAAGIGTGPVSFTVDANTGVPRSGTVTAADQTFTVTQAAPPPVASFTVTPPHPVAGEVLQFNDTSTGFPTSWSWDFGDGGGSTAQNPTHTYAAAGSYTVTLTVANATAPGSVSSQVNVITGFAVWLPVVSHVSGRNGAEWRSDLGLLNPGTADATVQGHFHSASGVVSGTTFVPGRNQLIVADVVGRLGSTGSGALEILSDQPVVVTSRTYDQLASGTVGQDYASYSSASALGTNESAWLPQLTENPAYHTNISLTNTGTEMAIVTVALVDELGNPLGSYDVTLAPGEWAQENQPFINRAGQTAMDQGYAKVTVTAGSGIIATASVIDNVTNDPTTIAMTPVSGVTGAGSIWIPAVSHVRGSNGTQWRSDVGLLNPGPVPANVQELFHGSGDVVSSAISIPAAGQLMARDLVGLLGSSGSGALEVVSDQPLVVTSRTYDQLASGTVGQEYASYSPASALGTNQSAWLPQLTENGGFHTNISLTNTGAVTATVTVALFDGAGNALGSYDVTLAPGEWAQENQPFFAHAQQTAMDRGYARVTVTSGSGVITSASVTDNVTHDPTTVAMVR